MSDAAYMKAVRRGDMGSAQRMVDEAAKAAGFTLGPLWHGTHSDFNQFETGRAGAIYFTSNKDYAGSYGPNLRAFYVKADKVADLADPKSPQYKELVRAFNDAGGWAADPDIFEEMGRRSPKFDPKQDLTWEIFDYPAADAGAGLIRQGFKVFRLQERKDFDSYAVTDPKLVKLTDPVTHDDKGNVIPLSKRFQATSADIRNPRHAPRQFPYQYAAAVVSDPVEYALGLVRKAKAYNPEEEDEPVAFPILFHSGVGDPNEIRKGIEPRFGDWVGEVLEGATDEEIDPEESYVPLAYFDSEPNWVTAQAGRKGGISIPDVTLDDVRKYGQLAVIYNVDDKYGGAINKVFKIGPGGYNGGYTEVTDVYGREMKLYETGLEEEGFQPKTLFGVEPGDIISNESITPDVVLTGDDLVRFMRQYYKEFGPKSRADIRNPRHAPPQFPYRYAAYLKAKFPDIWRAGGNIRGNDAFRWWTAYRRGDRSPTVMRWWTVTRPAWIARHYQDHRLPGVVAQIKWGTVGVLGVAGMKRVVEDAIRRRYAN